MTAPKVIAIPDSEWVKKTGKDEKVIAYTWGNDDGAPNGEDTIVCRESHFEALLNDTASRKVLFTFAHELGHNFDRDREGYDPVYDHPRISEDGYWAAIKDGLLVKKMGTMCAIYQMQWFKTPKRVWTALDAYRNVWREERGM